MIFWELKLMLSDYKKIIIIFLAFFLLTATTLEAIKNADNRGYLFQPFEVGVVSYDNYGVLDRIFTTYNNMEDMSNKVTFTLMELEEAEKKFNIGLIPAYVIVPEDFSHNVIIGVNDPVTVIGNNNMWIQTNVVKMIVNSGISFLTSSQAGIYSTIDYSDEIGISSKVIDESIVMPINMQYAFWFLGFSKYFEESKITLTGDVSFIDFYTMSLYIFLIMLLSIGFMTTLNKSTSKNILIMYKRANKPLSYFILFKILSLFAIITIISLPAFMLIGWDIFIIVLVVSSLVFFINSLSEKVVFNSLVLLFLSFVKVFVSGGIVPIILLPNAFKILSKFTVNYYLLNLNSSINYIICFSITIMFFVLSYVLLVKRRDR